MMNKFVGAAILSVSLVAHVAHAGTSQNSTIAQGNAILLGGTQPSAIYFDGQNRGVVPIEILIENGNTRMIVKSVEPGQRFNQRIPKNQSMVLRNTSKTERARVYWHVSGYSSRVNLRRDSAEETSRD